MSEPDERRELAAFAASLRAGARHLAHTGEVAVGTTPRRVVDRIEGARLWRFEPLAAGDGGPPLLLVYSLANRHWITDLEERRSLVRALLARGLDVYLLDWGEPGATERRLDLSDYVLRYLDHFVDHLHGTGRPPDLLGICQGGTFSLCYAALEPASVRRLVTMVTPVDFHAPDDLLSAWVRNVDIDLLVDVLGDVPGELLNQAFRALRPLRLTGRKYLDMVAHLDRPEEVATMLRMERWIGDSPPQAGEAFRAFVRDFYQGNRLVRGGLAIGGRAVDLARVRAPVLNVYATRDHIVPPAAARALARFVPPSRYREVAFDGGHIGAFVSRAAQALVPQEIARWLRMPDRPPTAGAPS